VNISFENQTALITGSASGIGKATALLFAENGAKVVISDLNEAGGEAVVTEIKQKGGQAIFVKTDVADFASQQNLHEKAIAHFGSIDVAVNNAGIGGVWSKLADYDHKDYAQVMCVNVDGVFFGMQLQIKQMLKQGKGNIINIASIAGLRGLNYSSAYCASKHAVIGLTKSAALDYARNNIRINAVCPVFTRTPLFEKIFEADASYEEKLKRNIPMGRYGTPEEIAQGIYWLCAEQAGFMTGQAIALDGGMTAN
jgi:NAD(P)-dependent dehydrogenase (short-subunit alcohol dehydrogenase family)